MADEKREEISLKIHANNKLIEEINAQRFNQKLFKNNSSLYYYDFALDNTQEIEDNKDR